MNDVTLDINDLVLRAARADDPKIAQVAQRTLRAAWALSAAVTAYERKDEIEQARQRLAELDAERAKLAGLVGKKRAPSKPRSPISHGKVGGAQAHRIRGEEPCEFCRFVELQHLAKAREIRAEKRAAIGGAA